MLLSNGLQQQYLYYEKETVVRRIACNNVRYSRLTSRYGEFCPPLGDVSRTRYAQPICSIKEIDSLSSSALLKRPYNDTNDKVSSEILLSSRILISIAYENFDFK